MSERLQVLLCSPAATATRLPRTRPVYGSVVRSQPGSPERASPYAGVPAAPLEPRGTSDKSVPQLTQRLPLLLWKEVLVSPRHLLGLAAHEVVNDAVIHASPGQVAAEGLAEGVKALALEIAVLDQLRETQPHLFWQKPACEKFV
jgi:hypothetical protein